MKTRTKLAWLWGSGGALALFNLPFALYHFDELTRNLQQIPQSTATILTGIGGFGALAWQTNRGFRNLVAGQVHRAQLDREAREHQFMLAAQQNEKEVEREKKTLAAALHGELIAIQPAVQGSANWQSLQATLYEHAQKNNLKVNAKLKFYQFQTPIYDNGVNKLGLLGPSIAGDVSSVFTTLKNRVDLNDTDPIGPEAAAKISNMMAKLLGKMTGEIVHVAYRLMHVQGFRDDPGPLLDYRRRQDAEEQTKASASNA